LALCTAQANAVADENVFVQAAVKAQETYTTNANFGVEHTALSDWITEVIPSLIVKDVAKRFQLTANVSVDGIYYLRGAEPNRVLPTGGVDAVLEAVQDHLFVDAGVVAVQTPANVLLANPQGGSTFNNFTIFTYHVSPDFKGELPLGVRYDIHSDNAWTHASSAAAGVGDTYFGHDSAELASLPQPIGFTLRVEQIETRYVDSTTPSTREQFARLIIRATVDPQLVVGLRGGRERENFINNDQASWITGAEFDWKPTDRSDISAFAEKRIFGTGFHYSATHHNPFVSLSLTGDRDIVTATQLLFTLPATGNVAGLLDAMLTAQYPDPVGRAQAVQNLMESQNLPNTLAGPTAIMNPNAYLSTVQSASAVVTGQRNAIALILFVTRTQPLPTDLTGIAEPTLFANNYVQRGGTFNLTHQLSPFTKLGADATVSRFLGNGAQSGTSSRQEMLTLHVNHSLSSRTDVLAGTRIQYFSSNLAENVVEKAVFVALNHRF